MEIKEAINLVDDFYIKKNVGKVHNLYIIGKNLTNQKKKNLPKRSNLL
jgi:hypothetical protein